MTYFESIVLIVGCIVSVTCIGGIPAGSIHFFDVVILIVAMAINLTFFIGCCMNIIIKKPYRKIIEVLSAIFIGTSVGFKIAMSDRRALGGLTWD